jgi:hypothetical protein
MRVFSAAPIRSTAVKVAEAPCHVRDGQPAGAPEFAVDHGEVPGPGRVRHGPGVHRAGLAEHPGRPVGVVEFEVRTPAGVRIGQCEAKSKPSDAMNAAGWRHLADPS